MFKPLEFGSLAPYRHLDKSIKKLAFEMRNLLYPPLSVNMNQTCDVQTVTIRLTNSQ